MEDEYLKKRSSKKRTTDTKEVMISDELTIIKSLAETTPNEVNNSNNIVCENSKENSKEVKNKIEEYLVNIFSKERTLEEMNEKQGNITDETHLKSEDDQTTKEANAGEVLISEYIIHEKTEKNSVTTDNIKEHDLKKDTKSEEVNEYDPKNIRYEGELAIYEDPLTRYQYEWNKEKEEWVPRNNVSYGFEDDTHTYTDADGVKFFWDKEKNAWFPKINDDFMAQYQMNYGFISSTSETSREELPKPAENEKKQEQKGIKRKPSEPSWFEVDEEQNTKVYVSNLPTDITEEEFVDFMQKCGLIMRDPITQKMKIKLYTEPGTSFLKGDALCTYIKIESVNLALKLLDGAVLKNSRIKVERARFQMKGEYDPKLKPKAKKKKEKQKLKKMQEKLFDWRPEKMRGERAKHEKIVIVKNLFDPKVFDEEVGLILEYQQDLREECSKCGEVRKVLIYDRHPEGVAQINMKEPEEADACVILLNNRWFGKRQITAEIWDGKTKYKIAETDSEISQRLTKWDKFLEGEN